MKVPFPSIVLPLIFVLGVSVRCAFAQNEPATQPVSIPLPAAIEKALTRNAEQLGPSITIAWKQRHGAHLSADEYAKVCKVMPAHADWAVNRQFDCRVTWQGAKFIQTRVDRLWATKKQRETDSLTYSFDGEDFYCWELTAPENGDASYERVSGYSLANFPSNEHMGPWMTWSRGGVLESAGYRMPGGIRDITGKVPTCSMVHALLDAGARLVSVNTVELDGRQLIRLCFVQEDPEHVAALKKDLEQYAEQLRGTAEPEESQRELVELMRRKQERKEELTHLYWLDPSLNYALRQSERHLGGVLHTRTICDDFAKVPQRDLFFPRKIVNEDFHAGRHPERRFDKPIWRCVSEVTDIDPVKLDGKSFIPKIVTGSAEFTDSRDDPDHQITAIINEDSIPPRGP
ncbi:hypothetical protein BH09PLA1_BH09PLA1_36950 [soil metagenome]